MTNHMTHVDADDFPEPHMDCSKAKDVSIRMGPNTIPFFHEGGFDHPHATQPREIHVGSLKIGRQKGPVRITVLGKTCGQPRSLAGMLRSTEPVEFQAPLPPGLTAEEHLQTVKSAWNGLTVSLAIVCAIMIGVLVVHAAARAGWL